MFRLVAEQCAQIQRARSKKKNSFKSDKDVCAIDEPASSRELRRPIALIDGRPGPLNYPFCALPSRVLAETPMEPWYLSFD